MRRALFCLLLAPPGVVLGCSDLIGIGELPGLGGADGAADGRAEGGAPTDGSSHDGAHTDGGKGSDGGGGGDAGSVTLAVTPAGLHLVRGTSQNVTVNVTRKGAPASKVAVTVTGLPAGVTAGTLTIPASGTMGTLALTAALGSTLGPASVSVHGESASAPLDLVVADPTGTYDTTFGTGGGVVTYTPSGASNATVVSVVFLDDGSFIVGGSPSMGTDGGWTLIHVLLDGTIDATFAPALPSVGHVTAVARGPKTGPLAGTLLVSGSSQDSGGAADEATLYIVTEKGAPYDAFNGDGSWSENFESHTMGSIAVGAGASTTGDVYVACNGAGTSTPFLEHFTSAGSPSKSWSGKDLSSSVMLVGGWVDTADDLIVAGAYGGNQFFAQRYKPASGGTPDPAFVGGTGAFGPASAFLYAQTGALDPDAGVYVGGAGTGSGEANVLGHVSPAGKADLGGDAGWVKTGFTVQDNLGYLGLAVQSDGRVLGVGYGSDMMGTLPFIARLTPAGQLDPTFNGDGGTAGYYVMQSTTGVSYTAVAAAPPPDGRIVIAGNEGAGMFLLRIWP